MDKEKQPIINRPYDEDKITTHAAKVAGIRNLREVSIITDGGEYQFDFLIKKPSRSVLEAITSKKESNDINGVAKLMLGCVLEGDKEAYENDGAIYEQLLTKIGELVSSAEGHLKKL